MTAFWLIMKEHWPKVLAAILVPVILGAIALHFAKKERDERRAEERLVESGRQEVITNQQDRTLRNVEKAQDAERNPTLDDRERVRSKYDRCADPAACE